VIRPPSAAIAVASSGAQSSAAGGEGAWVAAVGVDEVDLVGAVAARVEGDRAPVGGPGGGAVVCRVRCQSSFACAVGVHEVDVPVAVAVAVEGDRPPVG